MAFVTDSNNQLWVERKHEVYAEYQVPWTETRDCYTGEVVDGDKVEDYLVRKATAESYVAFQERASLADYTNHFATVVDSLAGMLFSVEGDAKRIWAKPGGPPAIGTPDDSESPIGRLWQNADGKETGWLTFFKQLAMELIHSHRAWVLVDTDENKNTVLRLFPALAVTNWMDDGSEVIVKEHVDTRTSLRDEGAWEDQYLHFTLDGWDRYKIEETEGRKRVETLVESGTYAYFDKDGGRKLPIFLVELPLNRFVGYSLAKKALAIFNKESERDHLLRFSGFPRLKLVATDEQWKILIDRIKRGETVLQDDPEYPKSHDYIAPPAGPAEIMSKVLERKVDEFYVTAFREFGDSARERTATEVRAQVASGIGAFLQLLKAAVDDAENQALSLVAQREYPNQSNRWFVAKVERSENFLPADLNTVIERLRTRYFGETGVIPVGRSGLHDVVRQVTEWDGVPFNEAEVKAAVDIDSLNKLTPLFEALPVPPIVRVDMTLDLLVQLGRLDPEAVVQLDDGTEMRAIDKIRQEMLALAETQDRERQLLSESFGGERTEAELEGRPAGRDDKQGPPPTSDEE